MFGVDISIALLSVCKTRMSCKLNRKLSMLPLSFCLLRFNTTITIVKTHNNATATPTIARITPNDRSVGDDDFVVDTIVVDDVDGDVIVVVRVGDVVFDAIVEVEVDVAGVDEAVDIDEVLVFDGCITLVIKDDGVAEPVGVLTDMAVVVVVVVVVAVVVVVVVEVGTRHTRNINSVESQPPSAPRCVDIAIRPTSNCIVSLNPTYSHRPVELYLSWCVSM
jgi:hypothetical protein